jgi:TonB-linked SusC/RagA family outer membrane protein
MRKSFTMLLCIVFATFQLAAQTRTLKGMIRDDKNNPLANVSILVKGTTLGTNTVADGSFSLAVPATAKHLVVKALGFATQEVAISNNNNTYAISLKSSVDNLEEVVVTGYSREKKSQYAGASTVISSKAIETVPVGAFDQALQGRAPGMLVNSASGQPGTSASVTIRGVSSISGQVQPLYILDGVPLPAGDFATLNPDDFESITVLKDASASAIYGARGGLGVIVITTKRGKAGATNFTFRNQYGFTQRPDFSRLNLMSTREMLQYEEREKFANTPGWVYSPLNPAIPTGMTAASKQRTLDSIAAIDINYADILYRQGISSTNELSMSGGSDKTRIYMNLGTFNQEGIDLNSSLKRYTLRFNLDHATDKFSAQFNSSIGYSITQYSEGEVRGSSTLSAFQMTYRAKTYENPYKADGSLNFGTSSPLVLKQIANLLEANQNSSRASKQFKINAGLTLSYKLFPFLTIKNTVGIDMNNSYENRFINAASYVGSLQSFTSGLAQEGNFIGTQLINTAGINFNKNFASKHDVEAGVYFEAVRAYQKGIGFTLYNLNANLTGTGQGASALPTNGAATYPQNATSAQSGYGIRSYFATGRYTYDNKYTLTANIRRDGTSRIVNVANKEITTWAAGFAWNTMQEDFMRNQSFFTDMKVRASYGNVPNIGSITTGVYGYHLGNVTNYTGPQVPSYGTTSYVGSLTPGIAPTTPGNPNLQLEFVEKWNAGVDFAIWNNRARFSVDAYYHKTKRLFASQILSSLSGLGNYSLVINAGNMENKGLEFTAAVDVVKSKDLMVSVGWNHSINRNKITNLGAVNEFVNGTSIIRVGIPFGSAYTYNYLGADPATGQPRYSTADGKETFDVGKAGQFAFGSYLPVHQGGATLDIRYKAFTVSALFSYQFDVMRYDNTYNWIVRGTLGYQQIVRGSRDLLTNQWTKAGDQKLFQASAYDRGFTSADLFDAKFVRLRNLTVGYQIPSIKAGNTTIIKSARFYVQAQNLAIWSPWKGLDPEDNNNISLTEYPNPKYFVVGLDISF